MLGVIYKISCSGNNNFLFGSTINFNKRKYSHLNLLKKNKHYNNSLQYCYNTFGEESISIEIVQFDIHENKLLFIENIWVGANCSRIDDNKGGMNYQDPYRSDRRFTSEEFRNKLSTNIRKPIFQYSTNDGRFLKEWDSLLSASDFFCPTKNSGSIGVALDSETRTAFGYIWKREKCLNIDNSKYKKFLSKL